MDDARFLARDQLQSLIAIMRERGLRVVGPQWRDGAIVFVDLEHADQLPRGYHDEQAPGHYRGHRSDDPRYFAWANGPQALKPLFFTPRESLWRATQTPDSGLRFEALAPPQEKLAVIGVRACDLAALRLSDKHFLHGAIEDTHYRQRRENTLLIAVNCSHPAATCFCASTGDGPAATADFDLRLDELDDGYLAAAGSERGAELLAALTTRVASEHEKEEASKQTAATAAAQKRHLPEGSLRDRLFAAHSHAHWQEVAERCLSCSNCTSVCPTCFCHREDDLATLDGAKSEHFREWDSCFTPGHSYIHGLTIRADTASRYRQWLTHKFAGWHDQFGRSGCVGCGRCITWCPTGIDVTDVLANIVEKAP